MFGYVRIFKDELKIKDYNIFRAYYCGLCKQLGKTCSQCSRLGLSYDMTFLAIVLSGLEDKKVSFKKERCIAHPSTKKTFIADDNALEYAADMSCLLYYGKLKDDWADDRSIKALFGMLIYKRAYKKAYKRHPKIADEINLYLKKLYSLEKENSSDIDEVSDKFAKITELLFSPSFAKENERQLKWLGYNIGRWIYIIDAYADIEKDFKKQSYNPFLANFSGDNIEAYKKELSKNLTVSLTFTLENTTSAYNLMHFYKNKEIIENILFLGLLNKTDEILKK